MSHISTGSESFSLLKQIAFQPRKLNETRIEASLVSNNEIHSDPAERYSGVKS